MRQFVRDQLPEFQKLNPQIQVETQILRNRHPVVQGEFSNRTVHPVGVKNLSAQDIMKNVAWLRSNGGRKATTKIPLKRQYNRTGSIQGRWTTETFAPQQQQQASR